ncbi:MAG: DUF883 family protein [Deltaproteobacteria bacterium]|nr:DUF883 family protein [Deltaproteobacteria bacterium]
MTSSLQSTMKKENLENLKDDASQVAEDMVKLGRAIQGLAADSWESVQKKLSDAYAAGQDKVSHLEKKAAARIRERPLQALMIAAGVGFLIGWIKKNVTSEK